MAAAIGPRIFFRSAPFVVYSRKYSNRFLNHVTKSNVKNKIVIVSGITGLATSVYVYKKSLCSQQNSPLLLHAKEKRLPPGGGGSGTTGDPTPAQPGPLPQRSRPLSSREQRFQLFASLEYQGQMYMSPQDFLESVTQQDPRARIGRQKLTSATIDKMLSKTPSRRWGSGTKLFRDLHNFGIISYTEYLFLLCVITKPHSGFKIAFNMFDTDGNQRVDKNEFLVIRDLLSNLNVSNDLDDVGGGGMNKHQQQQAEDSSGGGGAVVTRRKLEQILMNRDEVREVQRQQQDRAVKKKAPPASQLLTATNTAVDKTAPEREQVDTTLLVHLFGKQGNETLKYEDFYKFMDNLQSEVLEIEFNEFSKGMKTISEEEFARILLRYTKITVSEQEEYIDRLRERMPDEKGITFQEFRQFCQFLNNIDDFVIAMRIYTLSDHPVTQSEFQRAVKISTGCTLNDHLVDTVFQIFDKDGDGTLSYREFLAIMKDRIHRGFRTQTIHTQGWDAFKHCVKHVLKNT